MTAGSGGDRARRTLPWPPPGLERLQGDLWRIAGRGALAGGLLVAPLLLVVARTRDLTSLGPFADAWWVTLALSTVGLAFAADALVSAARLLRRAARALEAGYDLRTVVLVASDRRQDMGFLLQGLRTFSVMERHERQGVARLRIRAAALAALAGLWLPVILGIGLLVAAWGGMGPTTLWTLTVVPAMALYTVGGVFRAVEDGRVGRARRAWFGKPWLADLSGDEISAWRAGMEGPVTSRDLVTRWHVGPGALRRLATVVALVALVVAVPVLTLVPASTIGPVLAMVALPRFSRAQERAAGAEGYRAFRVAPDPALSPEEAGGLLQDILYAGSDRTPPHGERPPARRFSEPWIPEGPAPAPLGDRPDQRWPDVVFRAVRSNPSPKLLAYLDGIAAHPAQEAFGRLAHAASVDVASGRWVDPLPPDVTLEGLPIPRFGEFRQAAIARLAAAAGDLARGRTGDAEEKIKEVVSVGLLLGDEGPTLLDNLVGYMVAGTGGTALEEFYDAVGREDEADRVRELAGAARRASRRIHTLPPSGTEAFVRSLPDLVQDTLAVRGLRWEYFILTATLTPCLNLQRMVFGPGDTYRDFVERSRRALVRWPSEDQLFDLARVGYWGGKEQGNLSLLGRILGVSMRKGEGSCANVMARLQVLREAM